MVNEPDIVVFRIGSESIPVLGLGLVWSGLV